MLILFTHLPKRYTLQFSASRLTVEFGVSPAQAQDWLVDFLEARPQFLENAVFLVTYCEPTPALTPSLTPDPPRIVVKTVRGAKSLENELAERSQHKCDVRAVDIRGVWKDADIRPACDQYFTDHANLLVLQSQKEDSSSQDAASAPNRWLAFLLTNPGNLKRRFPRQAERPPEKPAAVVLSPSVPTPVEPSPLPPSAAAQAVSTPAPVPAPPSAVIISSPENSLFKDDPELENETPCAPAPTKGEKTVSKKVDTSIATASAGGGSSSPPAAPARSKSKASATQPKTGLLAFFAVAKPGSDGSATGDGKRLPPDHAIKVQEKNSGTKKRRVLTFGTSRGGGKAT